MAKKSKQSDGVTKRIPSLLEPESRGGDISSGGNRFQASVTASYAARWLSMEGFTSMLSEGVGDTEAKFYVPGYGYRKEFIEAKNHRVDPAEFWREVRRCMQVDAGAPGEYQWFTLAATGLSDTLMPLVNSLRRIRNPYGFYGSGSPILDNSYAEYVSLVTRLGHDEEEARFLYEKVLIDADLVSHRTDPAAIFKATLIEHHPEFRDLPDRVLQQIYTAVHTLIQGRGAMEITRVELEHTMLHQVPINLQHNKPVVMYTGSSPQEDGTPRRELYLPWADFAGGGNRAYPAPQEWDKRLIGQLRGVKEWMESNRSTRRIRLLGSRRLSASVAIGLVFPSVEGFSIEMMVSGSDVWATDDHPNDITPAYALDTIRSPGHKNSNRLVVSLGILRDCSTQVDRYLETCGLGELPALHLYGGKAVTSAQQANLLIRELKNSLSTALADTGARQIDLFLAVPSQIALFLGHRLNATASVRCYEWVARNEYIPTIGC